ncbi:uncharacterized protein K02A2.6-like [Haliotis rubra]|uniref:uncharacterized protein K02A2.6-like n=1 Tax=Haliotis rubra TaxID=36100 RepID=UPI001EE572AF|nr:uncharacterized protein K02A2.6-like [Haliotis rubra]
MNEKKKSMAQQRHRSTRSYQKDQGQAEISKTPKSKYTQSDACGRCGNRSHASSSQCPANRHQCRKCGKWGHFEKVCYAKAIHILDEQSEDQCTYNTHDQIHDTAFCDELYIDSIDTTGKEVKYDDQAFVKLKLRQQDTTSEVNFKIDTGAMMNIIPEKLYQSKEINKTTALEPTLTNLLAYGGIRIQGKRGKVTLDCTHKNLTSAEDFIVLDTEGPPIIGLQTCLRLNILQLPCTVDKQREVMDEYADVFEGLGLFPGEHSIRTNPEILPAVNAPRNVPVALRNKVKEEIERMENIGVLIKVDEPTPWVNFMVVVEKPKSNKVRICLDPKELNKAVQREHHRIPNLDDVISKLAGSKYFSKLDARSGYWQIKLTEESSMLTTFNTPYGRYRFTRMPFGLHSAQDVFQKRVDETYEGLDGVDAIADDILIYGRTLEEHNTHLRAALQRSRERGVKLNKDKCVIGVNEVTYFGHKFTSQGLMPDPVKVTAIVNMDPPANKEELLTILGMANYLAKFVPNLSDITATLRMLTRQDAWQRGIGMQHRTKPSVISRPCCHANQDQYSSTSTQKKKSLYKWMPQNMG